MINFLDVDVHEKGLYVCVCVCVHIKYKLNAIDK